MHALDPAEISVVIPTRDRAERVLRAVASVLAQTRPAAEVLVVDDGSRDDTRARLADVFADRPQVRCLVLESSRGVSAARNHGIAAAASPWLAFLDSDDVWLPEKLAAQMEALAAAPGHRVCHCDELWIRNGRRVNPGQRHAKRGGWIFRDCLPLCAISPSAVLVHRAVFADVGLFDETLPACEDYDLWLRLTAREPVLYVDRPLVVKYGGHADQLSRTIPALDRYRIQALEKLLASGGLSVDDRQAALATLAGKIAVYAAGAKKRGRDSEAAELVRRRQRLLAELEER